MKRGISPWGKQCKVQMLLLGKKLEDIAADTGISRTYISAIINGRNVPPDETYDAISKSLNVDPHLSKMIS